MSSSDSEIKAYRCASCGAPAKPYDCKCEYCGSYFDKDKPFEYDGTRSFLTIACTTSSVMPMMYGRVSL